MSRGRKNHLPEHPNMMEFSIRSGGQTGVDRAALDFAVMNGLNYGGWCPRGGWAEDYPTAPGLLVAYPRLAETASTDPKQRTAWNVRDSHATLILVLGDALDRSQGTLFTRQSADLFLRPLLVVDALCPDSVLRRAASGFARSLSRSADRNSCSM